MILINKLEEIIQILQEKQLSKKSKNEIKHMF